MTEFETIWYRSQDGLQLYARDYKSDTTAGELTVICLPGLTRNSADFHDLSIILSKRVRVIAVDFRGRGLSDYDPNPQNYTPVTYAADVKQLISVLGLSEVVLIGTSLGGLVSMVIASEHPAYLSGVVLNDFGPTIEMEGLKRIRSYVGKGTEVTTWGQAVADTKRINGKELPNLSEDEWLNFAKNIYHENEQGKVQLSYDPAIAQTFAQTDDSPSAYDLWPLFNMMPDIPMLVVRGQLSDILSIETVEKMQSQRSKILSSDIPNRGHAPLLNEVESINSINQLLNLAMG